MHGARRAQADALVAFFEQPPLRDLDRAPPEARAYFETYVGSALLGRRIVEGLVLGPWLLFSAIQLVRLAMGRELASDVAGQVIGIGLGLLLFVVLPFRLYFRSVRRRNEARRDGLLLGTASRVRPHRVNAGMSRTDGGARPI